MSQKTKDRIFYGAIVVFGVAGFVWTFFTEPEWWKMLTTIGVMALTAVLGYAFKKPEPPTP